MYMMCLQQMQHLRVCVLAVLPFVCTLCLAVEIPFSILRTKSA